MIHYSTPYSIDRNIGQAYNDEIRYTIADDDDWFVIMDGDVAFLTPEWGRQIHDVAIKTDFSLIGCMTGRLRSEHQLYNGEFDTKCDMYENYDRAAELERDHWGEVKEAHGIAGLFMMFQRITWAMVGGFDEETVKADMEFCKKVRNIGGRIGIMTGLYAFHGYRMWERTHVGAKNSYEHLINKI